MGVLLKWPVSACPCHGLKHTYKHTHIIRLCVGPTVIYLKTILLLLSQISQTLHLQCFKTPQYNWKRYLIRNKIISVSTMWNCLFRRLLVLDRINSWSWMITTDSLNNNFTVYFCFLFQIRLTNRGVCLQPVWLYDCLYFLTHWIICSDMYPDLSN